jgi:hypothetical protein
MALKRLTNEPAVAESVRRSCCYSSDAPVCYSGLRRENATHSDLGRVPAIGRGADWQPHPILPFVVTG